MSVSPRRSPSPGCAAKLQKSEHQPLARLHSITTSSTSPPGGAAPAPTPPGPDAPLVDRVRFIIDLIRPAVQADGGDIELVGITPDKIVQIRMHGACVGCPSSAITLQTGIERNLREHIPEVSGILSVE